MTKIAQRLIGTLGVEWIAERLRLGTRGDVTHLLYWRGRKKPLKKSLRV